MAGSTGDRDGACRSPKIAEQLEEARRTGYFVDAGEVALEAWRRDRQTAGEPCVWVLLGRKTCEVFLDLNGADFEAPARALPHLGRLLRGFIAEGGSCICCGPKEAGLSRVPRDRAEELARILVRRARRWKAKQARKAVRT